MSMFQGKSESYSLSASLLSYMLYFQFSKIIELVILNILNLLTRIIYLLTVLKLFWAIQTIILILLIRKMQQQQLTNQQTTLFENKPTETAEQAVLKESEPSKTQVSATHAQTEHDQQSKELIPAENVQENPSINYGKSLVILRTKWLTLFIGPDYLCFIPTFLIFVLVSYLLISHMDRTVENVWAILVTRMVCWGECISYLLVAFSDPGIAKPTKQNKNGVVRTMFCRKCRFNVPNKTYHCSYCDVCIEGYDHHCPWTSKCIGKNNIFRFYVFLFMTPVFIVYCAFAFGFTMPTDGGHHLRNQQKQG